MNIYTGFPGGSDGKESTRNAGDLGLIPELGRSSGGGNATHSSILPGEFHGQRSLADYSPWGWKESDMTEQVTLLQNIKKKQSFKNLNIFCICFCSFFVKN